MHRALSCYARAGAVTASATSWATATCWSWAAAASAPGTTASPSRASPPGPGSACSSGSGECADGAGVQELAHLTGASAGQRGLPQRTVVIERPRPQPLLDRRGARGGSAQLRGPQTDELSGGNNNDIINALGGGRDLVNCGLGTDDQVIADEADGVNGDCERITRQ